MGQRRIWDSIEFKFRKFAASAIYIYINNMNYIYNVYDIYNSYYLICIQFTFCLYLYFMNFQAAASATEEHRK